MPARPRELRCVNGEPDLVNTCPGINQRLALLSALRVPIFPQCLEPASGVKPLASQASVGTALR